MTKNAFTSFVSLLICFALAACVKDSSTGIAKIGPRSDADAFFFYGDDINAQAKLDAAFEDVRTTLDFLRGLDLDDPDVKDLLTDCKGLPTAECATFSALSPTVKEADFTFLVDLANQFFEGPPTVKVTGQLTNGEADSGTPLLAGVKQLTKEILFVLAGLQTLNLENFSDRRLLFRRIVHEITHAIATKQLDRVLTHGTEEETKRIQRLTLLVHKLFVKENYSAPQFTATADTTHVSMKVNQLLQPREEIGPLTVTVTVPVGGVLTYEATPALRVLGQQVQAGQTLYSVYVRHYSNPKLTLSVVHADTGLRSEREISFNVERTFPTTHALHFGYVHVNLADGMNAFIWVNPDAGMPGGYTYLAQNGRLYDEPIAPCNVGIERWLDFQGRPRYSRHPTNVPLPGIIGYACSEPITNGAGLPNAANRYQEVYDHAQKSIYPGFTAGNPPAGFSVTGELDYWP